MSVFNEMDLEIVKEIQQFYADPRGFVQFVYPWGKEGTPLAPWKEPDKWQIEFLEQWGDEILKRRFNGVDPVTPIRMSVVSGHGVGKAQAKSLKINYFNGEKRWGDLKPGDQVFGSDGSPTTVVAVHEQGVVPIYKVSFDDGSSTLCCADHLWNVRGRQERRKGLDTWRTLSVEQILEIGVQRKNGVAKTKQWEIPVQGSVQFEEREIDVHPYFVGLWLGDGAKGQANYAKPYEEIADRVRGIGYDVHDFPDGKTKYIRGIKHLMVDPVFSKGSRERYIPDDYKFNSIENRMELLRGLLDSDGECHSHTGTIGYSSTSKQLANDVIWLVRSLGGKAMMQPKVKYGWTPCDMFDEHGRHYHRECYRVTINLDWNPFTLKHRKERFKPSEKRYQVRWIESIEYSHDEEAMCITVDAPDHLYLANDFIVTHNSAISSWIIHFIMSTRPNAKGVVTSGKYEQLKDKTWAELAKWRKLAINGHWFEYRGARGNLSYSQPTAPESWVTTGQACTKENADSFAGLHNARSTPYYLMDEASAIPDEIFEVAEGGLTDGEPMIFMFGNPTKATGKFADSFGRQRHRWITRRIDSRTARMTNKEVIQQWIDDYGEDSDFVRVRVKGEAPRVGDSQFISTELVENAQDREVTVNDVDPIVIGVDVARFGCFDDQTEILTDQGWKLFSDLGGKEQVLSHDDQGVMSWEAIDAVHKYEFDGNLNLHQNKTVDFCVTDNHNFVVRSHPKSSSYVIKPYHSLAGRFVMRTPSVWVGVSPSTIEFESDVEMPYGGVRKKRWEFLAEDWAEFLGWFISEGNVYQERRGGGRLRILISQCPTANPTKRADLEVLLTRMGIRYRVAAHKGRQLEFSNKLIGEWLLKNCGKGSENLRLPDFVKNGSQSIMRSFLRTYLLGDGTCRKDGNGKTYVSCSKQLLDDVQEVLVKLGMAGGLTTKHCKGTTSVIEGRELTRKHDCYVLYQRSAVSDIWVNKADVGKHRYTGMVYCVSTKFKTICVRRNGKVCWTGNSDTSVVIVRQGRKLQQIYSYRELDLMQLSARVIEAMSLWRPHAVFVDGAGIGAGVVDRLRQLGYHPIEVQAGSKADVPDQFVNKRAEMWWRMREWLENADIPNDDELKFDLIGIEYSYDARMRVQMEKKSDMKARGLPSPDKADALSISFAEPVNPIVRPRTTRKSSVNWRTL